MQSITPDGIELDSSTTATNISTKCRMRFLLISDLHHPQLVSRFILLGPSSPDDLREPLKESRNQLIATGHIASQDNTLDRR
jgi:hypothetical protein